MATVQILEWGVPVDGVASLVKATDVTSSGTAASHTIDTATQTVTINPINGDIRYKIGVGVTAADSSGSVRVATGSERTQSISDASNRSGTWVVSYIDAA